MPPDNIYIKKNPLKTVIFEKKNPKPPQFTKRSNRNELTCTRKGINI